MTCAAKRAKRREIDSPERIPSPLFPSPNSTIRFVRLESALEYASLVVVDVILRSCIGCCGSFHLSSYSDDSLCGSIRVEESFQLCVAYGVQDQVDLEPVVKGTLNVLRACTVEKVKRVVYISDIGAVMLNPNWPKDRVKDETCWSDPEYCRATGDWYFLSKTEAERVAFEYGKQNELDVVAVLPGYVFGPVLQPTINLSSLLLANFVKGIYIKVEQGDGDTVPNKYWNIVDARDIANAILLVYEKHEAEGRYICMAENIKGIDLVEKLKSLYPDLTYLENFAECEYPHQLSSEKLQKLGWTYRPLEETLVDSIENYRQRGLLD
ncbi:cinnamoyl-CoA reductase 1-like isoform X1 [Punica granatum]|uniref:Cinnamoyl-CoA reductase 1-like isoform X1 n=1 Tax=Punica granatum TaxID=22663 RepID=A0A218WDL3_PUNGR|nr:cinnamoyl-CoA reductase 1-like isoform X1 [Punica granatum]OWM70548.1 hypothetical protein CDL15_Pgr014221 [Punica granatum]